MGQLLIKGFDNIKKERKNRCVMTRNPLEVRMYLGKAEMVKVFIILIPAVVRYNKSLHLKVFICYVLAVSRTIVIVMLSKETCFILRYYRIHYSEVGGCSSLRRSCFRENPGFSKGGVKKFTFCSNVGTEAIRLVPQKSARPAF